MKDALRKYQIQLGLLDWDISLVEDEAIESTAQTKLIYNDYKAIIRINKVISDVEKEKALIHELLHLIFRDAYDIFTDNIEDGFAKEYCGRQHERAIEKTAKIIYSLNKESR
jgi:Zn-dependent peptidase ImmA (M78 family)